MITSPATDVRERLIAIIEAEFAPEGFRARDDQISESLGASGTVIGVAPEDETPQSEDMLVQDTTVEVRFYGKFTADADPARKVSPKKIEGYAERFRRAVRAAGAPHTSAVWYLMVRSVTYPDDPTGNKTRFVARVGAYGNNSGLVETTG